MENRKTILIIDDDKLLSAALTDLLKSDGHEAMCCSDGMTAIELTREKRFQIIISDYSMPGMNGAEVVYILRRQSPDSFIIGFSGDQKEKDFVNAGANVFLKKPFDYPDLVSLISDISSKDKISSEKN